MIVIKKYSNRRLYDTEESRYVTLDELAERIRRGTDVQIVDAKSGDDLTQATLTQIVLEGPAAGLLPVPLLHRLIRLRDDALGEFLSTYVTTALDFYLAARDSAQSVAPLFPFSPLEGFVRMASQMRAPGYRPSAAKERRERSEEEELSELRREVEALRREVRRGARPGNAKDET